ncbi:MAG: asparagine synthase (glutamine-hydrolyzing) [Ramlibacter sp.]
MCGLAGIIGRIGPGNRAALARMNGAMVHRGPDADGFWEAPPDARGFGPMLAHRRLSILDLSPAGAQPMVDPVTGGVVVLNGEIYNYVELREQLAARGHHLQSSGDTAALLRHLALDGIAAVPRFRGMYAFAFWDPAARKLLVARDPLGIKPLYIARNPDPQGEWTIAFASEVRALLASGLLADARLNPQAIASLVWNGFTVAPHTAVQGIESFLPGELRVFDAQGREEKREEHWSARATASAPIDEEGAAAALQECVRLHLASDVPLGVFLSSGIDSSAVANLAQKTSQSPVHTFTLAFEEAELNEGVFARRIAQAIGTEHQEVVLTERFFIDRLESALDSLDQPSFDGLNSYFMSQAVAEAGFKVALVGSGGDELFGGYTSFRDLPKMLAAGRASGWVPASLRQAFARRVAALHHRPDQEFPAQTRWAKLPAMVDRAEDLVGLYQLAYALFLPDFQRELLAVESGDVRDGLPAATMQRLRGEIAGRSPLSAISTLEQRLFLGERLLRDTDAASMAASIEVRLPLVDQVLFQQVDRLPDDARYQPVRSKAMLRRIGLRGLDPKLFDRPKSGFELPFNRWLRSALGSRIDATLRDPQAVAAAGLDPQATQRLWTAFQKGVPGLYWTRIWALFALVHWSQRHRLTV